MKGISREMAHQIEGDISRSENYSVYRVRLVKSLPDINLKLPKDLEDHLTGNYKKFIIGGPVFVTVECFKK
jgi:O-phosphoseryl-tRNA(Cys) synthetase